MVLSQLRHERRGRLPLRTVVDQSKLRVARAIAAGAVASLRRVGEGRQLRDSTSMCSGAGALQQPLAERHAQTPLHPRPTKSQLPPGRSAPGRPGQTAGRHLHPDGIAPASTISGGAVQERRQGQRRRNGGGSGVEAPARGSAPPAAPALPGLPGRPAAARRGWGGCAAWLGPSNAWCEWQGAAGSAVSRPNSREQAVVRRSWAGWRALHAVPPPFGRVPRRLLHCDAPPRSKIS